MTNKNNSGATFKNTRKEKDTHPDYTGTAMIDDKEYYISTWIKEGQKGKYFSHSFKLKEIKPDTHNQAKQNGYVDDEIPF